jgi:hypothetical protein
MSAALLTTDRAALKLVLDERGRAWYLDRDGPPVAAGLSGEDFLDSPVCLAAEAVRVPAQAKHAWLLLRLWQRKLVGRLASVQLCRPPGLGEPAADLLAMRARAGPPSRGGWLEMVPSHAQALGAAAALAGLPPDAPEGLVLFAERQAWGFARAHPVGRALAFLDGARPLSIALLLGLVLDPRLFADPDDPDGQAVLESYLGVAAKHLARARYPAVPARLARRHRLAVLHDLWVNDVTGAAWRPEVGEAPGSYFRWYFEQLVDVGLTDEDRPGVGAVGPAVLATDRLLIDFVRQVWLDALYPQPAWGERLFEPTLFFRDAKVARAFQAHRDGFASGTDSDHRG